MDDIEFAAQNHLPKVSRLLYAHRDLPRFRRGVRLDIPSAARGLEVVSVHMNTSGGRVIGYDHSLVLDDVDFIVHRSGAVKIGAAGAHKYPMAFLGGTLSDTRPIAEGVEIYYNPRKVHLYVDAKTLAPVRRARQVHVIGKRVWATDVDYYLPEEAPPPPEGMASAVIMPTPEKELTA